MIVAHEDEIEAVNRKHEVFWTSLALFVNRFIETAEVLLPFQNEVVILKERMQEEKQNWEKSLLDEHVLAKNDNNQDFMSLVNYTEQQTNGSDKAITEKIRWVESFSAVSMQASYCAWFCFFSHKDYPLSLRSGNAREEETLRRFEPEIYGGAATSHFPGGPDRRPEPDNQPKSFGNAENEWSKSWDISRQYASAVEL